jgi:hypothetical protein
VRLPTPMTGAVRRRVKQRASLAPVHPRGGRASAELIERCLTADDLAGQLGALAGQGAGDYIGHEFLLSGSLSMYYEEKWIDGWLWWRRTLDGPWLKATEEQMIARMRKALELVVEPLTAQSTGRWTCLGSAPRCWRPELRP